MQGINRVFFLVGIIHIALFGSSIFLANVQTETPNYGGSSGFLPSTGDPDHAYDRFSNWLASGSGAGVSDPGEGGGFHFLKWILGSNGPLCGTVTITKLLIGMVFLEYELVNLLPADGFGNWFRLAVHLIGAAINLSLIGVLVGFAIRAGVLSNPHLLVALGFLSIFAISSNLLNAGGLVCV